MKNCLFLLPGMVLLLSACSRKDEVATPQCQMMQSTYSQNNIPYAGSSYDYDARGRLTHMVFTTTANSATREYTYYPDSVVLVAGTERTVYYLNSQGLAESAVMITPGYPATGMRTDYVFSYNYQGYMVSQRAITTQYPGSIPRYDTSTFIYTIENGNITRLQSSDGNDYRYSYTTLPLTFNCPELNPFLCNMGEFLGRKPANIVAEMNVNSGLYVESYSYTSGADNRITLKTVTRSNAPTAPPLKIAIVYRCN